MNRGFYNLSFGIKFSLLLLTLVTVPNLLFSNSPVQPAILTGTVTSASGGDPVTGAKVIVGTQFTYTVAGGFYTLLIDPPGLFVIQTLKPGFDNFYSAPVLFQSGITVTLDISLLENTNPPGNPTALLDTTSQTVDIFWQIPPGNYELIYEDGIQDDFAIWAVHGNMYAVKFTPAGYPVTVDGGSVNIGKVSDYPAGSNPLVPFQVAVYDATGPGGRPGALISGPYDVLPSTLGWITFTFGTPVAITSGEFYLVMIQGGNSPNAAGIAIDKSAPGLRSFSRFVTGGGPWVPGPGNYMLRARLFGPGGPMLIDNTADAIEYYHIFRLRQGEELNPAVWTDLGTTSSLNLADPGWNTFPCGPYRWSVVTMYSQSRPSAPGFSNILGKCWTISATINVDLSCPEAPKSGVAVRLKNLVYPDTSYSATLGMSGTCTFPHVWKGSYELKVTKFGYQDFTSVVPLPADSTIPVILLQKKTSPVNLEVNDKSLVAHWDMPMYSEVLFSEDWSSASFLTNGWTVPQGSNWIISTISGNPTPSAMFGWSPQQTNYSESLLSPEIAPSYAPRLTLAYDIFLDNFGTTTVNQMAVEAWDGNAWVLLKNYSSASGSKPWTRDEVDVSALSGIPLQFRFRAYGEDTYDINSWNLDNITVSGSETQQGMINCVLGYNVYIDNVLSGFTTDNKYTIPGTQVLYGSGYNACVRAVYGSGISDPACDPFVSGFLWPPSGLIAVPIENSAHLTWIKPEVPDTASQPVVPPGLAGYMIYRDDQLVDSIDSPDQLSYFDYNLEPGSYSYSVTAKYDLTDYGYPGQADESFPAGPSMVTINFGKLLPFNESWDAGSFSFNSWTFAPSQGNWIIRTSEGDPPPAAAFTWDPLITGYNLALVSPPLDGSPFSCANIYFDLDLRLIDRNATGNEKLFIEVFYNDMWQSVAEFSNTGSFSWTSLHYDISDASGKGFLLRLRASGLNSGDIDSWEADNIHVYAICKGARDLGALVSGFNVDLSWSPPDCSGGMMNLDEGFEEDYFPPAGWSQVVTDAFSTWSHMNASSPVGSYEGNYSAGVLWDYNHQDEWLIAGDVNVDGDLQFWSYAYQGSVHNDHYMVKVSSDNGNTWSTLLDMSTLPTYGSPSGYNQWNEPYLVDMSAFYGHVVQIAWQAVDGDGQGLWYSWAIDNCFIGNKKLKLHPENQRSLLGYDVYRQDWPGSGYSKITLNPIMDTVYTDATIHDGNYSYFVRTVFAECVESATSDTVAAEVLTGQDEQDGVNISLFPNPAGTYFKINAGFIIAKIEMINSSGITVMDIPGNLSHEMVVKTTGLPPGLYFVRICSPQFRYLRKLMVMRY